MRPQFKTKYHYLQELDIEEEFLGDEYEAGDLAVVSGWGTLSSGGESSDVLMKVEVPIVSDTSESVELIG